MKRTNELANAGLSIIRHDCLDGQVPCLLIEPNGITGPGKRGRLLRQQLAEKGINVPAYGRVQGVVMLLHGRSNRKEEVLPIAGRFIAAGFRCILPDLSGQRIGTTPSMYFGGRPSGAHLPINILEELKTEFGLPDEPAALWGAVPGGAPTMKTNATLPGRNTILMIHRLENVAEPQIPEQWRSLLPSVQALLDLERSGQRSQRESHQLLANVSNMPPSLNPL